MRPVGAAANAVDGGGDAAASGASGASDHCFDVGDGGGDGANRVAAAGDAEDTLPVGGAAPAPDEQGGGECLAPVLQHAAAVGGTGVLREVDARYNPLRYLPLPGCNPSCWSLP
mmetsp:Transcript_111261/g.278554  ORF Transcript_111261/g.278554 Transcript_111261/m.278554 type:complete len:114 (-) Transcript_111261:1200-1541(-)